MDYNSHCHFKTYVTYRVIQNKRAKITQDIGDAPLNNLSYGIWDP